MTWKEWTAVGVGIVLQIPSHERDARRPIPWCAPCSNCLLRKRHVTRRKHDGKSQLSEKHRRYRARRGRGAGRRSRRAELNDGGT